MASYLSRQLRFYRWSWALLVLMLMTTGCATYSSRVANLRPQLANGDFAAALQTLDKGTGSKDRLLLLLERGLVLHYADDYVASNEAFAEAEDLAEDLYTKSISQGALSLITSDESISYRARPFELAMVPYFKAMNYLYLGQRSAAVVEARRAELSQAKYVEATLADLRPEDSQDLKQLQAAPFLLYFSGLLHEQAGEINEAFISYRNAAAAYQRSQGLLEVAAPPCLAEDLTRTAYQLGFQDELDAVILSCPDVFQQPSRAPGKMADTGRLVVFVETGYVPRKTQIRFDFPVLSGEAYQDPDYWSWEIYAGMGDFHAMASGHKVEYWVSVAAPELQDGIPDPVAGIRLASGQGAQASAMGVVANLAREARITFDAEKPTIFSKTILRGLTKYLATRQAKKSTGKVGGFLANILGSATEKADTRSWLTLPDHILMGSLQLPAGTQSVKVDLLDHRGRLLSTQTIEDLEIKAGGWTFVSRRAF